MQLLLFKRFLDCCVIYFLSFPYSQSPEEPDNIKQNLGTGAKKARYSLTEDVSVSKINSSISQESQADCSDSEDLGSESAVVAEGGCESAQKSDVALDQCEDEVDDTFPTPRLPYPCLSGLSVREHRMYLNMLKSKKPSAPQQVHSFFSSSCISISPVHFALHIFTYSPKMF